jgi:hypothetical protein
MPRAKVCRENAELYLIVIASEEKQSSATRKGWIASSQVLLAMTMVDRLF